MARKSVTKQAQGFVGYDLRAIILLEIRANQDAPDPGAEKATLNLEANLSEISSSNDMLHYCNVTFESRRSPSKKDTAASFEATYGFLYSCSRDVSREAAQEIAKTVAWTKFSDLFASLNSQMLAEMPSLPLVAKTKFSA